MPRPPPQQGTAGRCSSVATGARSSTGGDGADDLGSVDEVKVYKEEGEENIGASSENLAEDKFGLVIETESAVKQCIYLQKSYYVYIVRCGTVAYGILQDSFEVYWTGISYAANESGWKVYNLNVNFMESFLLQT